MSLRASEASEEGHLDGTGGENIWPIRAIKGHKITEKYGKWAI